MLFTGRATKRDQLVLFAVTLAYISIRRFHCPVFLPGWVFNAAQLRQRPRLAGDQPQTYWVFDTAVIVTGLLLIPLFLWLHKRLVPTTVLLSRIATFFSIVGCIGFSLVGVFRKDFEVPMIL